MKFKEIENYINENFHNPKKYEEEIIDKAIKFINKIRRGLSTNSKFKVYADYDADGICSGLCLYEMINDYAKSKNIKPNIEVIVPSREMGYGLSMNTFEELQKDGSYVFTLDNGTHRNFLNNIPEESHDKLFIIDHHPNGDTSNMSFVMNPNKDGKFIISTAYLLDYIYEILLKVDTEFGRTADRFKYADLVALSLVSDMADLNNTRVRHLISKGFERIAKKERLIYQYLFPKKNEVITYNNIAFDINPRINSIGRLSESPKDAITIMNYKEYSNRGKKGIEYLNAINEFRKNLLNNFANEAIEKIKENEKDNRNIIFYYNEKIPLGLNGLVSQKINEIYDIPVLVASNSKEGKVKGSGRGFNIKYILNMFRDDDIFSYGGHNEALGFEVKDIEIFEKIIERINTKTLNLEKEFKNIILEDKMTISEYIEFCQEFSKKTNTIPFKQKFYAEIKDADISIKRTFKNNFCLLEIKDEVTNEKINYFTKHNTAKEIVENKEKFYISIYAEINPKKLIQDFSGDIILDKNIKKPDIFIEEAPDLYLYK